MVSDNISEIIAYCNTLNTCGIKISRFKEHDILAHVNFYGLDAPWLEVIKKI